MDASEGCLAVCRYAAVAAATAIARGVTVHLFPKPAPTPLVAFAVTDLRCAAGIVITASHNPAPYNGYKVYLGDGCQIRPPQDTHIEACITEAAAAGTPPVNADWDALWCNEHVHDATPAWDRYLQSLQVRMSILNCSKLSCTVDIAAQVATPACALSELSQIWSHVACNAVRSM